ncbi:hypothetical protein KUF83_30010 [Streptomyces sp. BV286]|uniref:hypothetical protein n=1 Tax=Streptomyces sp. BV286 TaxID=2849672 RepID=UPI001C2EB567|nr:hypothetical protein [Streptomyces sp. BV286]MBV1940771.1 hypothetical protein [Streptomyces sp. BV286]
MISLLDGLPEEARTISAPINGWTVQVELLVQLIEEISLLAADRRRPEPREIPRPYTADPTVPQGNSVRPAQQPDLMNGHRKMLAAAARRGRVHPHA